MIFPHEDVEFSQLLRIVADQRKLAVGLVEKDYWVTHSLWALCQNNDLQVWFKGGTSLSKGFSIIQRFSEDLDLRIDSAAAGVSSTAWPKKPTKAQIEARVRYFRALGSHLAIPGTDVKMLAIDEHGRGADYKVAYSGQFLESMLPPNSPFIKLEVGRALVTPFVDCTVKSFVHEKLEELDQLKNYRDNRAIKVRCVHPRVTLIEKLDAIAFRFERNREPSEYIRHYEDAARIIHQWRSLPPLAQTLEETAKQMQSTLRLKRVPTSQHPAFSKQAPNEKSLQAAYAAIAPMFWEPRLPLEEARRIIRNWIEHHFD